MSGVLETGGYSLICGFLTKDSQPFTVETNHVSLDRAIKVYRLRLGWNLNGTEFIIAHGSREWLWESEVFIYDGDGISEWYEIISCSGKS